MFVRSQVYTVEFCLFLTPSTLLTFCTQQSTSVDTLIQMNVHWDRYKLTSGLGTKQLKLSTNQLSLGMKQPWAQNDWIPLMATIELF